MKDALDKERIIQHKKKSIRSINNLMEKYLSAGDSSSLKKVDLLSYWIEEYTRYLTWEESFDPKKVKRYSRGDVIKVNFGFRVGNELGGLHFAVVIESDNAHSAGTIIVVPLKSTDGKTIHPSNVDLGTELYSKIKDRQDILLRQAQEALCDISNLITATLQADGSSEPITRERIMQIIKASPELSLKRDILKQNISAHERNLKEIEKLKSGSMAVINQITAISKQRIYTPKKSEDFLDGVSLSNTALEKINEKLKEKLFKSNN